MTQLIEGIPQGTHISILAKHFGAWGKDMAEATRTLGPSGEFKATPDKDWLKPFETPNIKHTDTPDYYKKGGKDLYDLFIEHYGLDSWLKHVEMECIQYLWRCREKGAYHEDIKKVSVITQRMIHECSVKPDNPNQGSH